MIEFAHRRFGEQIQEAWMDFNQTVLPDPYEKYPDEQQIFLPYFLFDWDPDRPPARRGRRPKPGVVAQDYLLEKASRLPELERLILEQSIAQPVRFYEVIQCSPGHGMVLRDVLIGGETEVEEHAGSRRLRPGDLVYAQLCRLPEVTALSRMAPMAIPPDRKMEVIALRTQLRQKIAKQKRDLGTEDLIQYRRKIRTVYLDIRNALHTPPKLCNTDSDPILFHTLTFRIGSAQVAFDALAPLAWGESKEDILDNAEIDSNGTLRSVDFDWRTKGNAIHTTWDNTILGNLNISGQSLVVEVNSANRAQKIRKEIDKRLGMLATLQSTRTQTPEQMIEDAKKKKATHALTPGTGIDAPEVDPEAMREVQTLMREETEAWAYRKIPALGGRTPMEAIADPDGKEIVEALLLGWERQYEKQGSKGSLRPDFDAIRRRLKLPLLP
jgi:hypothetical protein